MSSSNQDSQSSRPVRPVHSTLASCEFILANGGSPSRDHLDAITKALRGGASPEWEHFPRTRDWYTQLR